MAFHKGWMNIFGVELLSRQGTWLQFSGFERLDLFTLGFLVYGESLVDLVSLNSHWFSNVLLLFSYRFSH